MKNDLILAFLALSLCVASVAQDGGVAPHSSQPPGARQAATANSEASKATPRIAPGSVIPVQLTKSIDAKKAKTGDPVEAKVTQDLKTESGQLLVPKDTPVRGHVTEAQARSKEQKESELGIRFDHAVVKGGDVALPMSIQAVVAPAAANPAANPNNSAGESAGQPMPASPNSGTLAQAPGERSPGMGTGAAPYPQSPSAGGGLPASGQASGNAYPPITGNTKGVIGISNVTLGSENATQGSVLSSQKGNVKLESGTLLLLRVNQ
jgi:hypothetical protein